MNRWTFRQVKFSLSLDTMYDVLVNLDRKIVCIRQFTDPVCLWKMDTIGVISLRCISRTKVPFRLGKQRLMIAPSFCRGLNEDPGSFRLTDCYPVVHWHVGFYGQHLTQTHWVICYFTLHVLPSNNIIFLMCIYRPILTRFSGFN